ncbi:two-component sensor histidine kinase, partial [Streptomyces sp. NPDC001795]
MRLSTRIGLAVGATVPLLVLASGWLLLMPLIARDLHREEDNHLRQRATAVLPDARALLRAAAAGRPQAADSRDRHRVDRQS